MTNKDIPVPKTRIKQYARMLRQMGNNKIKYEELLTPYAYNQQKFQIKFTQLRRTIFDELDAKGQ